jgi:hypothetical protein
MENLRAQKSCDEHLDQLGELLRQRVLVEVIEA